MVFGVQKKRKGRLFERVSGVIFFKLFNALSTHPIPKNVITARLMTRRYVRALVNHQERETLIAGLWALTGFQRRRAGKKVSEPDQYNNLRRKVSHFVNAMTSFSSKPLVLIFYFGCIILFLSTIAAIDLIIRKLIFGALLEGWASLIVSIWLLGGLTIFCLGVIGIYLSKIFIEVKQRPYTIVKDIYEYSPHRATSNSAAGNSSRRVKIYMSYDGILEKVSRYYSGKLEAHGATARGVDWNSTESQRMRFVQLLKICDCHVPFSINDYGCGYGALVDHLSEGGYSFRYFGFDISSQMIAKAREFHSAMSQVSFLSEASALAPADYTVASGIFNVKLEASSTEWERYVLRTSGEDQQPKQTRVRIQCPDEIL